MTEKEQLEQSQATNRLLLEMVKMQKTNMASFVRVLILILVCYTTILVSMLAGFFWYESQFEVTEQVVTETTTTQEVSGEASEINNVQGDMYKDNATHNQGVSEIDK